MSPDLLAGGVWARDYTCYSAFIIFRRNKMSETSGGSRMTTRASRRCPHCNKEIEIAGSAFCNRCGKPQEDSSEPVIYCINPDFKVSLFTVSAKTCHKCHMPQMTLNGLGNIALHRRRKVLTIGGAPMMVRA